MVMTGSRAVSRQMLQSYTSLEPEGLPPEGCLLCLPVSAAGDAPPACCLLHARPTSHEQLGARRA
jgi:hypothetical protein